MSEPPPDAPAEEPAPEVPPEEPAPEVPADAAPEVVPDEPPVEPSPEEPPVEPAPEAPAEEPVDDGATDMPVAEATDEPAAETGDSPAEGPQESDKSEVPTAEPATKVPQEARKSLAATEVPQESRKSLAATEVPQASRKSEPQMPKGTRDDLHRRSFGTPRASTVMRLSSETGPSADLRTSAALGRPSRRLTSVKIPPELQIPSRESKKKVSKEDSNECLPRRMMTLAECEERRALLKKDDKGSCIRTSVYCSTDLDFPQPLPQLYCAQQIIIPEGFPEILKHYSKAAIRTQPEDLMLWSAAYFRALADDQVPPVKERLEYPPLHQAASGLTPGLLKILHNQLKNQLSVDIQELRHKWDVLGLDRDELEAIVQAGALGREFCWMKFMALACGTMGSTLEETMTIICNLISTEPLGGSAAIPYKLFKELYLFLAGLDKEIAPGHVHEVLKYLKHMAEKHHCKVSPTYFEAPDYPTCPCYCPCP